MRSIVTTVLEIGGAVAIVAGVFVLFGLGIALVVSGVLAIVASWWVTR